MMENIILIGFMGSGKTEVGRRLAERLGYTFVDTDAVIEKKEGRSIPDIFDEHGEAYFRDLETEVVKGLSGIRHHIISTGGGIVLNRDNIATLKQIGLVVWLKASPETIYERVRHESHRPILRVDKPMEEIKRLLDLRSSLYSEADVSIDVDGLQVEEIVNSIVEVYRKIVREAISQ